MQIDAIFGAIGRSAVRLRFREAVAPALAVTGTAPLNPIPLPDAQR